jgi:hypothetical protein
MNAPENKRMLWELTNHLYKAWMARDQVITLFEKTIAEVDEGSDPLIEKNKRFLTVYIERVAAIQPQDAQQRAALFEDRIKNRHIKKNVSFIPEVVEVVIEKEKPTDLSVIIEELRREVAALKDEVARLNAHCFR